MYACVHDHHFIPHGPSTWLYVLVQAAGSELCPLAYNNNYYFIINEPIRVKLSQRTVATTTTVSAVSFDCHTMTRTAMSSIPGKTVAVTKQPGQMMTGRSRRMPQPLGRRGHQVCTSRLLTGTYVFINTETNKDSIYTGAVKKTDHGNRVNPDINGVTCTTQVGLVELVAFGPAERNIDETLLDDRMEPCQQEVETSSFHRSLHTHKHTRISGPSSIIPTCNFITV